MEEKMSVKEEAQIDGQPAFRIGLQAAVYCIIWFGTYFFVKEFFASSPSRNVYAVICSWSCALYFSSLLRISLKAIPFLAAFHIFLMFSVLALNPDLLYHDPPAEFDLWFLFSLTVGRTLFFLSPLIIHVFLKSLISGLPWKK